MGHRELLYVFDHRAFVLLCALDNSTGNWMDWIEKVNILIEVNTQGTWHRHCPLRLLLSRLFFDWFPPYSKILFAIARKTNKVESNDHGQRQKKFSCFSCCCCAHALSLRVHFLFYCILLSMIWWRFVCWLRFFEGPLVTRFTLYNVLPSMAKKSSHPTWIFGQLVFSSLWSHYSFFSVFEFYAFCKHGHIRAQCHLEHGPLDRKQN